MRHDHTLSTLRTQVDTQAAALLAAGQPCNHYPARTAIEAELHARVAQCIAVLRQVTAPARQQSLSTTASSSRQFPRRFSMIYAKLAQSSMWRKTMTLVGLWILAGGLPSVALAETFRCTTGNVPCVIAAIAKSNANGPEEDRLLLDGSPFVLDRADNEPIPDDGANGVPVILGRLIIRGVGSEATQILRPEGAPFFRIFDVAPTGDLTLRDLTVQGGGLDLRFFQRAGCLRNEGVTTLWGVVLTDCSAWIGGAVHSVGILTVRGTVVRDSFAEFACGGICALGPSTLIDEGSRIEDNVAEFGAGVGSAGAGQLVIRNSIVDRNITTSGDGGGLDIFGTAEVQGVLLTENFSRLRGGAVATEEGTTTVRDTLIWRNTSEIDGGGAHVGAAGLLDLTNVTMVDNGTGIPALGIGRGGALHVAPGGRAILERSRLLFNQAAQGPDCFGAVEIRGRLNVIGDPTRFVPPGVQPCQ